MTIVEGLAESEVEALLEDESLRGDLTDEGFGLVIAWVSSVAAARATAWLQQSDPRAAMWDGVAAIKDLVRGVVGSAEGIAPEPLLGVAGPLADAVSDALDEVDWTEDPDANARAITAAIAALPWASENTTLGLDLSDTLEGTIV